MRVAVLLALELRAVGERLADSCIMVHAAPSRVCQREMCVVLSCTQRLYCCARLCDFHRPVRNGAISSPWVVAGACSCGWCGVDPSRGPEGILCECNQSINQSINQSMSYSHTPATFCLPVCDAPHFVFVCYFARPPNALFACRCTPRRRVSVCFTAHVYQECDVGCVPVCLYACMRVICRPRHGCVQ